MTKNKKQSKTKLTTPKRPGSFKTPNDCISYLKKCVYLIARGRAEGEGTTWTTLGTGFLAAPNRMITASHVINDFETKKEKLQHKDGDYYYLIRYDDEGRGHYRYFQPKINKEIFLYPEIDLGIIYLEDEFYADSKMVYLPKTDFLVIDTDFRTIGTQVGVLGYPLCSLTFNEKNIQSPKFENILLRADLGIINCRYKKSEHVYAYEFTVEFNPGNSGGPIFNMETGKVISLVHGFKAISIKRTEIEIKEQDKTEIGIKSYSEKSYIDVIHANYSIGLATPSFVKALREHKIIN